MTQTNSVKTIVKAFQLLDCISKSQEPITLEELSRLTGIKKPTSHRMLQTLLKLNLVVQQSPSKRYRLGPRMIALGLSALSELDLHQEARPLMKRLRDETGETVNLSIPDGDQVLIIERFRSSHVYSMNLSVGSRLPMYCTSQGRAILAFMNEAERRRILQGADMKPLTPRTIQDKDELLSLLRNIRQTGYSINREEFEIGIAAVAGPILNHAGQAVASLNISFALARHPEPDFIDQLARKVTQVCGQLSHLLGYEG